MSDFSAANHRALSKLKTLLNTDLKEICRREGLLISGVKAVLQDRVKRHLEDAVGRRDAAAQARIQFRIDHNGADPPPGWPSSAPSANVASSHNHAQSYRPSLPNPGQRAPAAPPARLNFKPSPFYHIQDILSQVTNLPEMPANRNTVSISISLSDNVCERLQADTTLKVMLYCTASSLLGQYDLSDVAFPAQIEVKMNQEEIKSNYKGLKNKPGTTKPADLTNFLRKQPRYPNNLQISYALTTKRYSIVVNLVKKSTPEELMAKIKSGRVITKERVLGEMARKADDADIQATSAVMSLKDPVSTMRMDLPCRSTICTHNQCFDALCFLQLQEQAPTWTCPICNKTISYEALAVDNYVLDILNNTAKSVEQVVIEPKGEWKEVRQNEEDPRIKSQPRASYDDDSDDDLVEISDVNSGVPLRRSVGYSATPAVGQHMTPPLSSREASVTQNGRNKRQSAVIDLTLSDEDEPPRPAKRTQVAGNSSYHTPSSITEQHHRPPSTLYSGFAPMQSPQSLQAPSPRPPEQQQQQSGARLPPAPWPNYNPYNSNGWNGSNY